ncbi:4-oxalocrotonate tautomerase family protein [Zavarzinia sp.]|uniref:tautomerase family protein n=1 Tax=Zavarzinia sp. TaxID=2027920 RepID=UPI003561B24D
MPIIEMHMLEGRTTEQKHRVAAAVTEAVVGALGVKPETVRILITEHDEDGFFVAGQARKRRPVSVAANGAEEQHP